MTARQLASHNYNEFVILIISQENSRYKFMVQVGFKARPNRSAVKDAITKLCEIDDTKSEENLKSQ